MNQSAYLRLVFLYMYEKKEKGDSRIMERLFGYKKKEGIKSNNKI